MKEYILTDEKMSMLVYGYCHQYKSDRALLSFISTDIINMILTYNDTFFIKNLKVGYKKEYLYTPGQAKETHDKLYFKKFTIKDTSRFIALNEQIIKRIKDNLKDEFPVKEYRKYNSNYLAHEGPLGYFFLVIIPPVSIKNVRKCMTDYDIIELPENTTKQIFDDYLLLNKQNGSITGRRCCIIL